MSAQLPEPHQPTRWFTAELTVQTVTVWNQKAIQAPDYAGIQADQQGLRQCNGFDPLIEVHINAFAVGFPPVSETSFLETMVESCGYLMTFVVCMTVLSKGILKAKGRIFPFGCRHLL